MEINPTKNVLIINNNVIKYNYAHINNDKNILTINILKSDIFKLNSRNRGVLHVKRIISKKIVFISNKIVHKFINVDILTINSNIIYKFEDILNVVDYDAIKFEYKYSILEKI